jgi:flagellar export protein FliJ
MAPYRFPLEKVLNHKESLKELQVGKVKEIDVMIQTAKENKLRLEWEIDRISHLVCQQDGKELSAGELLSYYRQMRILREETDRLVKEIERLLQRRSEEMEILLELHREIKMLEKLKEKGLSEYRLVELKKEIEMIDETNVMKYARNR